MDGITLKIGKDSQLTVSEIPNHCPYCHKSINPIKIGDNFTASGTLEIIFRCPSLQCNKSFIGTYYYEYSDFYSFFGCNIGEPQTTKFSEEINTISPNFVKIYNESSFAEQHNLTEICGVGYRKALEFLIKDYLIKNNPMKEENIKKKPLGNCIKDDITDPNVKKVALRAVWLGNDETHYVKLWEEKSLTDLKKLISLTLHWIQSEELTNSFETEMPEKK
jgi:hypothetical protein